MREYKVFALILLCCLPARGQAAPPGWKFVTDNKATCRIAVPPEWAALGESSGAAVFHDAATAIAVVTSQAGQEYKPLNATLLKVMGIPKERMFENTATRVFYQDRVSRNAEDGNSFISSVPAKTGTCSCRAVGLPSVPEEVLKKVALSLMAVPEKAD
jgi:hypothetical protein